MAPRNRIIPYDPKLRALARALRKNGTPAEAKLWKALKGKSLGYEFHRQVPMDGFIVDFFCHERLLVVEIDGSSHDIPERYARDVAKDKRLKALGVRVIRFRDVQVLRELSAILGMIQSFLDDDELMPDDDASL